MREKSVEQTNLANEIAVEEEHEPVVIELALDLRHRLSQRGKGHTKFHCTKMLLMLNK